MKHAASSSHVGSTAPRGRGTFERRRRWYILVALLLVVAVVWLLRNGPSGMRAARPVTVAIENQEPGARQGLPLIPDSMRAVPSDQEEGAQGASISSGDRGVGQTIEGLVISPNRVPVAGARVTASIERYGVATTLLAGWGFDAQTTSLSDGTFELYGLQAGTYRVEAQGSGDQAAALSHVSAGGARITLSLKFAARAEGVVTTLQGTPVRRFSVMARARTTSEGYEDAVKRLEAVPLIEMQISDENGRFSLASLSPGSYEIIATSEDGQMGRAEVGPLSAGDTLSDIRIVLDVDGSILGRVVNHESGSAVPGAVVTVLVGGRTARVETDATGMFVIDELPVGLDVAARFQASGYIDDQHTITVSANRDVIGPVHLLRGVWTRAALQADWVLEGRIDHTVVAGVEPQGLAARAGVVPGSIVISAGHEQARWLGPLSILFLASRQRPWTVGVLTPGGSVRAVAFPH